MSLRVMTYNILKGGLGRENEIREVIQRTNADVVILQEVTDITVLTSLAESLRMQWFLGKGNRKTKVALLSRLPVLNFNSLHPFPIWHNVIETEVRYQTNQSLLLIGVHLIPHLWFGFELWRYLELKYILARCKKFLGQPLLIAGDFNAIAPGDAVMVKSSPASIKAMLILQGNHVFRFAIQALLSSGFIDCFRLLHRDEKGLTYPIPRPSTRFDYVFVNQIMQKKLAECWVVRQPNSVIEASDHYPVVAEFDM
jgi:exonuclease III